MELAVGNLATFTLGSTTRLAYQNFFIGESISYDGSSYGFLPFGFSGITINRTGDNTEASLVLPNNQLSRNWGVEAIQNRWIATIKVMLLNPEDRSQFTQLHQYVGQVASGKWDETSLSLTLSTVLDAVGADIPVRRLAQKLIGAIPVTSVLQLQ
jgi:phage-related protein